MAVGYGVAFVKNFPTPSWHTVQQTAVDEDDEPATIIEPYKDWEHPELRKHSVVHESRLYFEGRYLRNPITSVVRRYRFGLYVSKDGSVTFPCAPKRLWHDAFRRISRDQHSGFEWEPDDVDLVKLRAVMDPKVGGAWFGKLQIARLETAGIFGPDVAASDEWEKYEQLGTLQAIIIEFTLDDQEHKLMLGQDGLVLLYRDEGEMANLALLLQVRREIVEALRRS